MIPLAIQRVVGLRLADQRESAMTKQECAECGRKITVEGDEHVVQKQFCPRCGTEFPPVD